MTFQRHAPEGKTYVCPACGRHNDDRYALGDTSCVVNSFLADKDKLVISDDNRVTEIKE